MTANEHEARYFERLEDRAAWYRTALQKAYDAIAHAENYRQEDHVARHLREAKLLIVDVLHNDGGARAEPLDIGREET